MYLKGNDFLKLLDYTPEQIDYLLKGLCPDCRAKRHV